MRAVDNNLLVRLRVRDYAKQAESAEKFIARGAGEFAGNLLRRRVGP
jgi:hypothetical protein